MSYNLVVLAAGMASRYGGIKQLESIGKNGETLIAYSVYDAVKNGCDKVIFIIRKAIEKDFCEKIFNSISKKIKAEYVFQEVDTLIPDDLKSLANQRTKPYGTVQAILSAKDSIDNNFVVINADDFYGRTSYQIMDGHFENSRENAIVGYKLGETLSLTGTVNRGICRFENDSLKRIEETYKISLVNGKITGKDKDDKEVVLSTDEIASMNFFGFNKNILSLLEDYWNEFVPTITENNNSECLLPIFCNDKLKDNTITFKCYTAQDKWFGMTYKEDRDEVRNVIQEYTKKGIYPEILF